MERPSELHTVRLLSEITSPFRCSLTFPSEKRLLKQMHNTTAFKTFGPDDLNPCIAPGQRTVERVTKPRLRGQRRKKHGTHLVSKFQSRDLFAK